MKSSVFESDSLNSLKKLCFSVSALAMAFIAVTIILFSSVPAQAQVIINEWSQGTSGGKEWVELLVTVNTDIRGWTLQDEQGTATGGVYFKFKPAPDTFWQSVPAGTLIVIYSGEIDSDVLPPNDMSLADGNFTIVTIHDNTALFDTVGTNKWGGVSLFANTNLTDNPIIKNSGGTLIHDWDKGNDSAFTTNPPRPGADQAVHYTANSISGVTTAGNYTRTPASSVTPGNPNGGANTRLINFLRSPVISKTPAADALSINKTTNITVQFSDNIDASTVTDGTFRINGSVSGVHAATFSGGGTDTITADPANDFTSSETVSVTLTTDIKSTGGVALASDHTWQFTIPPAEPSGLSAGAISHEAICLAWADKSTDETGFVIERFDGIHAWEEVGRVSTDVTSFTDTGLRYSWEYYYRVAAYNASGSSAYSNGASAWTWMFPYEDCDGVALNGAVWFADVYLPENSPPGTLIGTFTTISPTGTQRYEFYPPIFIPGIDNDMFEIVGDVLITGKNFRPDYETRQRYRVGLRSIAIENPNAWCHAEFGIVITDVPEYTPPARSLRASVHIDTETADGTAAPGDTLRLSASVVNEGDTDVTGAVFTVTLPEGTEYAAPAKRSESAAIYNADANQIEWTGDIPAGQTAEIAFDLKVAENAKTGDVIAPADWSLACDTDRDGINDITVTPGDVEAASDSASSGVTVVAPEPECLKGDVNGDGNITLADAVAVLQILTGGGTADAPALCADTDGGDGKIGFAELSVILRELAR